MGSVHAKFGACITIWKIVVVYALICPTRCLAIIANGGQLKTNVESTFNAGFTSDGSVRPTRMWTINIYRRDTKLE